MKKSFSVLLLLVILYENTSCQKNNWEAAFYNIAIGASVSSIGALINKDKGEKPMPVIVKGIWQGALGGYITFESKRLIEPAYKHDDWKLFWASKILNSAGTSIKENAALNRDFWVQWNMHIGFLRLELHNRDNFKFGAKALPIASYYTLLAIIHTDFEPQQSLKIGHLVFSSDDPRFEATNTAGVVFPGIMVLRRGYETHSQLQAHEIIHLYQQNDFSIFNANYSKAIKGLSKSSPFVDKLSRYIYPDLSIYVQLAVYEFERRTSVYYYDNFLEHEAGYYSNTVKKNFRINDP